MLVRTNGKAANHSEEEEGLLKVTVRVRTSKTGDLGGGECGTAVETSWSEYFPSYLQGFPHATLPGIYRGGPRRWTISNSKSR